MDNFGHAMRRADDERLALSINADLDRDRPTWSDFSSVYSDEEIGSDQQRLQEYFKKKGINPNDKGKLKDGILIEKLFLDTEIRDLFGEEEVYEDLMTDDEDFLLYTMPAHVYDDVFNNADMVCLVRNEFTDHEMIPFVVDCTSNSSAVEAKSQYKRTSERITGFTELKYFEDTATLSDGLQPGKLAKVPRFIVGFDAGLARELLTADYNDWTKAELDEKFDMIRYYLLTELASQSKQYETGLDRYFDFLLKRFEETHASDIKIYPKDAVMEEILKIQSQ